MYNNQYVFRFFGQVRQRALSMQTISFFSFLRQLLVFFNKLMFWEIYLQFNMQKIFKALNKWVAGKQGRIASNGSIFKFPGMCNPNFFVDTYFSSLGLVLKKKINEFISHVVKAYKQLKHRKRLICHAIVGKINN